MIRVYVKDRFIGGIRNQHCCNAEPYGGCCEHYRHWQEGGGWSDKTYVYCDALNIKVYLDPPVPNRQQIHDGEYYILLPDECELLRPDGQLSIFEMLVR